ncbi:MAG: DNA recombination protein RmuC [Paludibacteraceae bacterium]|nr:DNA recombination protein RmuC [Paludibacteraceae bacterium]
MEILVSFIAGVLLAAIGAYFVLRSVKSSAAASMEKALTDAAIQADANQRVATAKLQSDLENALQNAEQVKANAMAHTQELLEAKEQAHKAAIDAIEKRHAEAMIAMERRHSESIEAERVRFKETMDKMTAQVQNAAGEILKQQQEELKKTNKESVEKLIAPLNQQMESMNKLMADTRSANEKSTSSLEGTIKQMVLQTEKVGLQADNLAEAMKNKGKVHGDWGEQVLDDILEGSGLREGIEFTKQEVITIGNRESYRPDFIINTPEGGRIIVDSKVSLTAYTDAIGAETKEEYEQLVKKNYDSVWAHVTELAKKEYPKYVQGAMNYVLMFMPNEGAYVMAMNYNRSLAQEAYRKGIIILNPTNLMLTLNLVLQSWNGTRQQDNCQKILDEANGMYDKVIGLVDTGVTLSNQITTVASTCKKLTGQLSDGQGNLLKRVEKLRSLGITSTKHTKVRKFAKMDTDTVALSQQND